MAMSAFFLPTRACDGESITTSQQGIPISRNIFKSVWTSHITYTTVKTCPSMPDAYCRDQPWSTSPSLTMLHSTGTQLALSTWLSGWNVEFAEGICRTPGLCRLGSTWLQFWAVVVIHQTMEETLGQRARWCWTGYLRYVADVSISMYEYLVTCFEHAFE